MLYSTQYTRDHSQWTGSNELVFFVKKALHTIIEPLLTSQRLQFLNFPSHVLAIFLLEFIERIFCLLSSLQSYPELRFYILYVAMVVRCAILAIGIG